MVGNRFSFSVPIMYYINIPLNLYQYLLLQSISAFSFFYRGQYGLGGQTTYRREIVCGSPLSFLLSVCSVSVFIVGGWVV